VNRFSHTFERLRRDSRCGLFPWLMAGFPDVEASRALADAALDAGADGFEIGVPFSDPLADGATMQRANARALEGGATFETALDLARHIRRRVPETPIALMSYYNPLWQRGDQQVAADLADAEVDGLIVADLPPEEASSLHAALDARGIGLVPLLAPTSPPERIRAIARLEPIFVYCVRPGGGRTRVFERAQSRHFPLSIWERVGVRAVQLQLRLDTFEGPLELLLLLIEQRKLPITQVSLAQVADQYLAQVHAAPELDPDLLADFLAIAGKLLLLKSRALLLTEEHDPEVEQVATDLTERLAEYRVFRAAAEALRELEQRGGRTYAATRPPMVTSVPAALTPVGADALVRVWRQLLSAPIDAHIDLPGISRVSVDERRAQVLDALRSSASVSFRAVAGRTIDEIVATFLAVLELFRRDRIGLDQDGPFGDLVLSRRAGT
jgi:tryptophan synthase alpha subunit